jgi:transcription initiation factor TFIIIB Brf1 subunit/transcription initiation factor TFIIB
VLSLKCEICGDVVIFPQGPQGEPICRKCGLVMEERQHTKNYAQWSPEWYSNYNEQDSPTLKEWLTILRSVSCQLNIPNFPYREEAARTIRKKRNIIFKSQKLSKNKRETIAALLHLTLREYNKSRSIKQISEELALDPQTVQKQEWLLNRTFNEENKPLFIKRKSAIDYLHENSGKIRLAKELIRDAETKIAIMKKYGGNPVGLAAGALYHVCRAKEENISKEKIGIAFNISERTVYMNEARIRKQLATVVSK